MCNNSRRSSRIVEAACWHKTVETREQSAARLPKQPERGSVECGADRGYRLAAREMAGILFMFSFIGQRRSDRRIRHSEIWTIPEMIASFAAFPC